MNRRNFFKTTAIGLGSISLLPLLNGKESTNIQSEIPCSNAVDWINCNIKRFDPVRGNVPLKLNDEQINFIHYIEVNDESLLLRYQQRQSGYTTVASAYMLYRMIHDTNSNFLLICPNENQRGYVMNNIRGMYNHLPNQMSVVKSYSCDRRVMYINSNKLVLSSYNRVHCDLCSTHYKLAFAQDYSYTDVDFKSACACNVDKIVGYSYIG